MNAYDDFWPNAARRMLEIDGHVVDVEISVSARPTPHLTLLCGAGMASSRIELRAKSAEDLTRVLEELRDCADEVIDMFRAQRDAALSSRARGSRSFGSRGDPDARYEGQLPGQQDFSGPHDDLAVSSDAQRFEPPPLDLSELDFLLWPEDQASGAGHARPTSRSVPAEPPRKSYLGQDPRQKEREDAEYLEELERAEADELDAEIRGELLDDADAYAESDEEGWYYDDEDDEDWDHGDYDDDD